jgi:hypothetical protein
VILSSRRPIGQRPPNRPGGFFRQGQLTRRIRCLCHGVVKSLSSVAHRGNQGETRGKPGQGNQDRLSTCPASFDLATARAGSSAACHCGAKEQDEYLTPEPWRSHWTSTTWQEYLRAGETEARLTVIRQRTHTGRPLGTEEFIQDLEKAAQRRIALQKRGPREKIVTDRRQGELTFDP